MRQCSESMEQHSSKLNDQNESKEKYKHQTDGLQLQIFLGNVNLNFETKAEKKELN